MYILLDDARLSLNYGLQMLSLEGQQAMGEAGTEVRLSAAPLDLHREDTGHCLAQNHPRPSSAHFLLGGQAETEFHQPLVPERVTRLDGECPRRLVDDLERVCHHTP